MSLLVMLTNKLRLRPHWLERLWAVLRIRIAVSFHLSHVRISYGDMEPQLSFRIWEHAMYECFLRDIYVADMTFIQASFYQLKEIKSRSQWPLCLDFARSNTEVVGYITTQGMDVCVCLFCVCVVLWAGSVALRRADPPTKESHRLCID
jgi:hypothetical protein